MNKETVQSTEGITKVNTLCQDVQIFWRIQREWNRSKHEAVEMTVEQALQELRSITCRHPLTSLARNAAYLIEAIVTRQNDPLEDLEDLGDSEDLEDQERINPLKDHQRTLA